LLFAGDEEALLALTSLPPASGKVYLGTVFATEDLTPQGQELAKTYKERFGRELDVNAALAYEGTQLLTDALRKARGPGQALRKELAGVDAFESLTGLLSFTKEGCARRPLFVVSAEGGKFKREKKFEAEPK